MFFLFVALKVPLIALCWLVWWAIHRCPEDDERPAGTAAPSAAPASARGRCRTPAPRAARRPGRAPVRLAARCARTATAARPARSDGR